MGRQRHWSWPTYSTICQHRLNRLIIILYSKKTWYSLYYAHTLKINALTKFKKLWNLKHYNIYVVGWAAGRAPACKNWVVKKLTWLSVWSICFDCHDLHTVSWCHCHPITSCFSKTQNGLPFWRRLTRAVLEKRPLNGCSSGSSSSSTISFGKNNVSQHVQLIYWSAVTP